MSFDIETMPFSRRGSWLSVSRVTGIGTRSSRLHVMSHRQGINPIFTLLLVATDGGVVENPHVEFDAAVLRLSSDRGVVEICFDGNSRLVVRGRGCAIKIGAAQPSLSPFAGMYFVEDPVDRGALFTSYESGQQYRVRVKSGSAGFQGSELLGTGDRSVTIGGAADETWVCSIEEYPADGGRTTSVEDDFDAIAAAVRNEFALFRSEHVSWPPTFAPASEAAAYLLWSSTVSASGFLKRPGVLMSKHWMNKVWSWDHCFNAIALAPGDPDLALDQFLLPFDFQQANGALPDSVTHSEVLYNFVKPPIHGWAFRQIRARAPRRLTERELADVYGKLSNLTDFWLRHRVAPNRRLPHYLHGNDSGWDNATSFDASRVVESPDLAAFLLIQLGVLADLADELGHRDAGDHWRTTKERLQDALVAELWHTDHFVVRSPFSGEPWSSRSLLNWAALVASAELPGDVVTALVSTLSGHITEWGLATEPTDSPHYRADGYWRGPIWAPSSALIIDGLATAGFSELAASLSDKMMALCERSGFAENFDAISGDGLRDRAYTWTASVYLSLARTRWSALQQQERLRNSQAG